MVGRWSDVIGCVMLTIFTSSLGNEAVRKTENWKLRVRFIVMAGNLMKECELMLEQQPLTSISFATISLHFFRRDFF